MEGQSSCKINIPMGEMSHITKTVIVLVKIGQPHINV